MRAVRGQSTPTTTAADRVRYVFTAGIPINLHPTPSESDLHCQAEQPSKTAV